MPSLGIRRREGSIEDTRRGQVQEAMAPQRRPRPLDRNPRVRGPVEDSSGDEVVVEMT